jgi:hypothetical protein
MSRLTNDLTAVRALYGPGLSELLNTALVYATGWRCCCSCRRA